jgi:hypothetical protein
MLSSHRTRQVDYIVVLANEAWKTVSMGTSQTKDTSKPGELKFKVLKLSGSDAVSNKRSLKDLIWTGKLEFLHYFDIYFEANFIEFKA